MIITELVCLGKHASVYWGLSKAKVKGLLGMCRSNIRQLTKTVTAIQLTEHKNEDLVPTCQAPLPSSILVFRYNPFGISLRYEFCYLTENVLAAVHCTQFLGSPTKVTGSKVRQDF